MTSDPRDEGFLAASEEKDVIDSLRKALEYSKDAALLDSLNSLGERDPNVDLKKLEDAAQLYSEVVLILTSQVKKDACASVRHNLEELIAMYNFHIENMDNVELNSRFWSSAPSYLLTHIIMEIKNSKAHHTSSKQDMIRGEKHSRLHNNDAISTHQDPGFVSRFPTVNQTYLQEIESSEMTSRRTSLDSFATATSWRNSFFTAPSYMGSSRSKSSTAGVKNKFQALLQRGISPQLLIASKVSHKLRTQISRSTLIPGAMGQQGQNGVIKSSPLTELTEELESEEHEGTLISRQGQAIETEEENPFHELDWCGRGMHVDFKDKEEIPLEHIQGAGHGSLAVVDIVRCRRIKLARKMVRLPRRKVTSDVLQEVLALHRLSHSHIVRLVGTYIHKRQFATLLYPAAEINLEEYLEELQPDSSPTHLSELDQIFGKLEIDQLSLSVLREGSVCLTSGLRYLHNSGIIHSDIKPANIILKDTGYSKLLKMYFCDFGISKTLDPHGETQTEEDRGKTPRYAPPEVMLGNSHGRAADIYSFGCVLAEMATVYSGLLIKDFRNYIQFDRSQMAEHQALEDLTPEFIENATTSPFRAYHKHYRPNQIEEWFLRCSNMTVPNTVIFQMMNESPRLRPRLLYVHNDSDAMVFEMSCRHDDEGAPPFEVENDF